MLQEHSEDTAMLNAYDAIPPSPGECLDLDDLVPSMLAPDDYEAGEEERRYVTSNTVTISKAELHQMLDILAAVHVCWEDDTLPQRIQTPYLKYSVAGEVLDEKSLAKMRDMDMAREALRALLLQIKKILPLVRREGVSKPVDKELAALMATAELVRNHTRTSGIFSMAARA